MATPPQPAPRTSKTLQNVAETKCNEKKTNAVVLESVEHVENVSVTILAEMSNNSINCNENNINNTSVSPPPNTSCCSPPPILNELDNVPQWKKELIQRRKINIARTIGANQTGTCPKKSKDPIVTPTSPVTALTKPIENTNSNNNNNNYNTNSNNKNCSSHLNNTNASIKLPATSTNSGIGGHYTMLDTNLQVTNETYLACASTDTTSPVSKLSKCIGCFQNNSISDHEDNSNDMNIVVPTNLNPILTENHINFCNDGNDDKNCSSGDETSGTCLTTSQQKSLFRQQHQLTQKENQLSGSEVISDEVGKQQPFQLHSRHSADSTELKTLQSQASSSLLPSTSSSSSSSSSSSVITSLISPSCDVQSIGNSCPTSFIKNPQISKPSSSKQNKYNKINIKPSSLSLINNNTSGSVSNSVNIQENINDNNNKMVAAQDLDSSNSFDFDPSEELQYGPGIVSKLRCRYLSLALRQTTNKQRKLDNLRRATGLNNLLDNNDDDGSNSSCIIDNNEHHHDRNNYHQNNNIIHKSSWSNNTILSSNNSLITVNTTSSSLNRSPDEFVATFQKNLKISDKDIPRSRHIKRGNDSLKRARSVEALLVCDKTWDTESNVNGETECNDNMVMVCQMKHQYINNTKPKDSDGVIHELSSICSSTDVTIEDKITNSRERIIINDKPPKRLTSFIDDTERPPPDLVKQTLRIFEATANRRGRGLSRNNFNGEVAAKVANYKSIISQEKPPIIFPKPPLSPKKQLLLRTKPGTLDVNNKKCLNHNNLSKNICNNNIINNNKKTHPSSPISSIAKKFAGFDIIEQHKSSNSSCPVSPGPNCLSPTMLKHNESTPIKSSFNIYNSNNNSSSSTPDLIPRKIIDELNTNVVDSPIAQLTKKIERLAIESPIISSSTLNYGNTVSSGTSSSSSSVTNFGSYRLRNSESDTDSIDSCGDGENLTKRISKLALENISKAGTTLQYSFNNNKDKESPIHGSTSGNSSTGTSSTVSMPTAGFSGNTPNPSEQQQIKQIGIIRPLLAEPKLIPTDTKASLPSSISTISMTHTIEYQNDELNNKIRDNLVITNLSQTNSNNIINNSNTINNINNSCNNKPILTSREIEKNLINEKKNEEANLECTVAGVNKWQLSSKKKWNQQQTQHYQQQNSMVFNFKDRKEVPDYIENDGLVFKRRRELPKPNESGFVLLGDISLETSTDPDDSWTMGPPSPCDVEFENSNIVIEGKSSFRYRSKDTSLRVQFDDNLTSTFEYPSESSFLVDSTTTSGDNVSQEEHNIHIDDIKKPSQKLLGNMSLGSAPLGSYTPMKAQINKSFELGVTRAPSATNPENDCRDSSSGVVGVSDGDIIPNSNSSNGNPMEIDDIQLEIKNNSCSNLSNRNNSSFQIQNGDENSGEPESLQYLKPATDDLTVVYSEGTQKTDLLY